MGSHRKIWLVGLVVLTYPMCRPAPAQEDTGILPIVAKKLVELREAPSYKRSETRQQLVTWKAKAVAPILAALAEEGAFDEDPNFASQCILALGEIAERMRGEGGLPAVQRDQVSALLVEQLENKNLQLAYHAAASLGKVWVAAGNVGGRLPEINARLLAALYSGWPESVFRGPAMAVVAINKIPDPPGGRWQALAAEELVAAIDRWVERNRASVLPASPADLPWQINLHTVMTARDAAAAGRAGDELVRAAKLEAVGPILDALEQNETVSAAIQARLRDLLVQLTGIAFPPPLEEDEEPVTKWRQMWFERLRREPGQAYVAYSWHAFEIAVYRFFSTPDEDLAQRVRELRHVLVSQLSGREDIPQLASLRARTLLEAPLESKEAIRDALKTFREDPERRNKDQALRTVARELQKDFGAEVGGQFLQQFVALAYREQDDVFASTLGGFLGTVTQVPCPLGVPTLEERRKALREWAPKVVSRGYQVNVPEA